MVIYFGQLGNFWCVIASVSANKLACDRLLVGRTNEKKRTAGREKGKTTQNYFTTRSLPSPPTQFSCTFCRSCSAPLCWSREQAFKKWEDHHPDSSPGLLAAKTPLKKVKSRCFKLQAFFSSPQFFNCWRIFLELNFQELRLSWEKKNRILVSRIHVLHNSWN